MLPIFRNKRRPRVRVPRPRICQPARLHRGVVAAVTITVLTIGLLYAAVAVYEFGSAQAGFDRREARDLRASLDEKLAGVEFQRDQLLQQAATFARSTQIDREAIRQVRESLLDLQDERLALREEVEFLTSLLSDGETKAGLRARSFIIEPLENPGEYRYRFTLSKYPQNSEAITANMKLAVVGRLDGEMTVLELEKIVIGELLTKLEFKQVTQIEGAFVLPRGFVPERLNYSVSPTAEGVLGLAESVPWIDEP